MPRAVVSLLVSASLVFAATQADAKKKSNPRALRGKVMFSATPIPDIGRRILLEKFKKAKPTITLTRGKSKVWKATLVAFMKRMPYDGPITIWWYDKADKASFKAKEPAHVKSINVSGPKLIFVREIVMDPNIGFNKKHSYWIYVGQIIGKKHKYLARGLVSLER